MAARRGGVRLVAQARPRGPLRDLAEAALGGELNLSLVQGAADICGTITLELAEREVLPLWDARRWPKRTAAGRLFWALGAHLWRGWTLIRPRVPARGRAALRDAVAEEHLWGVPRSRPTPSFLAWTLIEQGNLEDARAVLEPVPLDQVPTYGGAQLQRSRAELFLAEGSFAAALDEAEAGAAGLTWVVNPASLPWGIAPGAGARRAGADRGGHRARARRAGARAAVGRAGDDRAHAPGPREPKAR